MSRRSGRVSIPVYKQIDVGMAEKDLKDTRKRKSRGEMSVNDKGSASQRNKKMRKSTKVKIEDEKILKMEAHETENCKLLGEPISIQVAKKNWPSRYEKPATNTKKKKSNIKILNVKSHYSKAEVGGITYDLHDDAYVRSNEGEPSYICKITEFFKTVEGEAYFTAQWFYRAADTVIGPGVKQSELINGKRLFFSDVKNDNPLECLVKKISISMIPHNVNKSTKDAMIVSCDYHCDMFYRLSFNGFIGIPPDYTKGKTKEASSVSSDLPNISGSDCVTSESRMPSKNASIPGESSKPELSLLDLYSGCGAMSTGFCLGAKLGGINLVTKWALDLNESACKSLGLNHPETKITNDCGENFLSLLREWERLCRRYGLVGTSSEEDSIECKDGEVVQSRKLKVQEIVGISYGNPKELVKAKTSSRKGKKKVVIPKGTELYFKVHWKGSKHKKDTWVAYSGLRDNQDKIRKFVIHGYKSNLLPLPGDVDIICGGPPCQGISGLNLHRNKENPLDDEKNYQMAVFMDTIEYLKPRYILMENVVDLLKYSGGFLARNAVGRLVSMDYQVRLGIMAAGSFGLPQFRPRVFLWGAQLREKLPPYPLPTHEAVVRGGLPKKFKDCVVGYDKIEMHNLPKALTLKDALFDLPEVTNDENRDTIPYGPAPQMLNEFQRYIRLNTTGLGQTVLLNDHLPLKMNKDDFERSCRIPKGIEGANFSYLPQVIKDKDGKWMIDPSDPRELVASGNYLVPDYALTYRGGKSKLPFGRLWWEGIVSTVVTRAQPHNQRILHPRQNRVLTVRENARVQGFFDAYKLCGDVEEKYIQVGNAVAVPVAKALGYAWALAFKGLCDDEPLIKLPDGFAFMMPVQDNSGPKFFPLTYKRRARKYPMEVEEHVQEKREPKLFLKNKRERKYAMSVQEHDPEDEKDQKMFGLKYKRARRST